MPGPSDFADPRPLPPGQRRVDVLRPNHYGRVPKIDLRSWALVVEGETADGGITRLTWEDVERLERVTHVADLHCVSRRTTQDLEWSGVPARAVLDLAPPADSVRHVVVYGAYGYHSNVTIDDLWSPRALFATHLGGEPLAPEHGWPMRLVLPHLYGWKGPKWVMALEYSTEPRRGFWEERGYHFTGDVWREERYAYQE